MGGENLNVDPEALKRAESGINATIGELNDMGMLGSGSHGRGFGSMALSGMEAGHSGLADAFGGFCERWGWGVRALVQDANQMAQALGMAAGLFHEQDQYVADAGKIIATSVAGNPHLSEAEITSQSWGENFDDWKPDYSVESQIAANERMGETWSTVGNDWVETQQEKITDPLGYAQEEAQSAWDGVTGPAEGTEPVDQPGEESGDGHSGSDVDGGAR
ncbi:hypothetical protein ABT304_08740 [Nocardioides sp. NPDC000445]|uniref:hypothetical protein n=1 Tax=Nocardioides sp. NPDC000445 TaxID=3154257 RepID=UPI00331C56B2